MKKLLLFFMSLNFLVASGQALSEGFEGTSVPDYTADDWVLTSGTWKIFDNGIGTVQNWREWTVASLVYDGLRSAYVQREDVTNGTFAEDWLVTPQVLVPADGQLRFYTRKALGGNFGTEYTVRISTTTQTTPTDFTVLQTWDDSDINSDQANPVYEQKVIDLTAYAGLNVYVAFVMTNDNGNRWLVDNVFVDQRCLESTIQSVSSINDTSVDLNWDNPSGATEWEIEWGPTGFTPGTGTLVTTTSNPYNLGGLTAATTYDFYVRPICDNENYGNWIGPESFTTAVCALTEQCDFDFVMIDNFGDGWNGNTMTISQFGQTVATITLGTTGPTAGDGPETITVPLCSDDPFEVFWNGGSWPNEVGLEIIDPNNVSIFTLPFNSGSQVGTTIFNGIAACTPPTCPQPSNVIVSGVNTSSGTITWTDNTSGASFPATEWQVIIQPAGSGYPPSGAEIINTTVFTTSYAFSGLSSDTDYEVWISAICNASGTPDPSYWEGPIDFSTSKDYCAGDIFTDSGGISGNYGSNEDITWTICPETPGDAVTVFFNSFATETNWDGLYVYDGPSTASPQIASANGAGNVPGGVPGSYWGNTIPGPFVSTHPSGCLTFRFRSDSSGTFAGWNANVVCGPPPTCTMPTNLQVVSTTSSTVTLGWTENNIPPATNWQIVQQAVGDGYPGVGATVIPVDTNPFTLPIPSTPVEYYVRTDCGGGDFSFWTGPLVFVAGDDWEVAVPICSFDDYTGTTLSSYGDESDWPNTWPELSTAFCGSIENDSFFVFEATGTTINMNVNVTCSSGTGVQFMIFDAATMGSGPVNEIGCYSPMNVGNNPLSFTGLTPGNTYYLMIDGWAGAVCDYTISLPDGSTTTSVNIIQDSQDLCIGQSIVLDAEGGNGNYTWSPAVGLDATTGNQVTFTPPTPGVYTISLTTTQTSIVCATSDDIVITVYDNTTPSFTNPGPLCAGSPNVPLDTTDANGILGTWTLVGAPVTEVDASTAGLYDYVFTPDPVAHPCSPVITMQVEIKAACTFGTNASAIYVDNCETTDPGEFFNITGSGTDLIGSPTYNYTSNDFGTYLQNSGNLILKGAELRSFKTTSSNVCQVNMYYRVYESSTAPGAFNVIALSLLDDCVAGTFPTGGTCDPDDQKWQNLAENIDLTQNAPGNYTIEVYYELIGDNDSPTACDGDIELLNNAGNNYLAEFTIQGTLTFSQSNEECASSNGSITISGFVPGDTYTVTYNDDTMPIAAVDYQADFNGDITIINLDAGTYDNFEFVINGCSIFDATQVVITNFSPSIAGITNNSPICFGNDATFTIEGSPNFDVDYTINGGAVQTVTLDASGFATVTVTNPAVGSVDLALLNIYNLVCNIVVTNTSSVTVNPLPVASVIPQNASVCYLDADGDPESPGFGTAVFEVSGTPNAIVSYTLNGGAVQTITLDASGEGTVSLDSEVNVEMIITAVENPITGCTDTLSGVLANVAVVFVPTATIDTSILNTCLSSIDDPDTIENETTTTIEVTSPLISQVNYPSDLFISEITDAQPGSLTYVEIYNGTGVAVDLSAYKIRVTTNGTTLSCDLPLSGILVNDDVVVIKLSSSADEGGVVADLTFTTCTGVNNNDRIALTTLADVDVDVWGTPDGTAFTPASGIGYNFQRITTGTTLPSNTWDPADWIATDWGNPTSTTGDYSDIGVYTLYALNYEYILSDGINTYFPDPLIEFPNPPTFINVTAGTYTLTVHDTATNCYSPYPLKIIINEQQTIDAFVLEECVGSTAITFPVIEGYAYDEFGNYILDVDDNPIIETLTGTWSPSTIDASLIGTTTYVFTPDSFNADNNHYYCHDNVEFILDIKSCTIQKGISPNGDGLNDNFDLSGYNVRNVEIFNRYGRKVYSKSNYVNQWYGQSDSGNDLPTGTYYYVIEFTDSPSKTGWIYINREE